MVYTVVEDNHLSFLKRRLVDSYQPKSYLDCVGRYHRVNNFQLRGDGSVDLVYKNQMTSDNFTLTLQLARLDFYFEIEKNNRCYREYLSDQWKCEEKTNHILRNNVLLVGLSVGDLLKHFYYTSGIQAFLPVAKSKRAEDIEGEAREDGKVNELIV